MSQNHQWREPTDVPCDGDSVWVVVTEWDGIHEHVDYAIVYFDYDGPMIKRYESDKHEQWPPGDVVRWMECDMPMAPDVHDDLLALRKDLQKLQERLRYLTGCRANGKTDNDGG